MLKSTKNFDEVPFSFSWNQLKQVQKTPLGHGAYGATYLFKIKDASLLDKMGKLGLCNKDGLIVVKIPLLQNEKDPKKREELLSEFKTEGMNHYKIQSNYIQAAKKNPSLISPVNPGTLAKGDDGREIIFSKYAPGGDFKSFIAKKHTSGEGVKKNWAKFGLKTFRTMLTQMNALHDAGFLHKDIALRNFLADKDGNPVLSDLGHATQMLNAQNRDEVVKDKRKGGIKGQAVKSQARDEFDRGTDLYALQFAMLEVIAECAGIDTETALSLFDPEVKLYISDAVNFNILRYKKGDALSLQEIQKHLSSLIEKKFTAENDPNRVQLELLMEATKDLLSLENDLLPASERIDRAFKALEQAERKLDPDKAEIFEIKSSSRMERIRQIISNRKEDKLVDLPSIQPSISEDKSIEKKSPETKSERSPKAERVELAATPKGRPRGDALNLGFFANKHREEIKDQIKFKSKDEGVKTPTPSSKFKSHS